MSNFMNTNFDSDDEDEDFAEPPSKTRNEVNAGDDIDADGDEDPDTATTSRNGKSGKDNGTNGALDEDDDEEELDDDEEDDEEDEEDEEDDHPRRHKRARQRPRNQFVEDEAEVDEDDEEMEEDDDDLQRENDFVTAGDDDDILGGAGLMDERQHREFDRQRQADLAQDAQTLAANFRDRYGRQQKTRMGDESAFTPKRMLLPSVDDPSIWGVKCKPGKEREAVFTIMKRLEESRMTKNPLQIISVLERGGTMAGYLYVEARKQSDVVTALTNVNFVYARSPMILVPIQEMPDLLRVKKKAEIVPGAYVRFKRGKYAGDLAQVENVENSGQILRIRAVPRLDYGATSDPNAPLMADDGSGLKRKRVGGANGFGRPPQRLFSEVEAKKYHAKDLSARRYEGGRSIYTYQGETYEDGYWCKDIKVNALLTENVNPKLEEVTRFASGGAEDGTENLDLHALAQSLKASTDKQASYLPGDVVEVYSGEQAGLVGKVVNVQGEIVTMDVTSGTLKGKKIEIPFKGLRKRFKEGDHVKVMGGSKYRDEVGMVVKIVEDRVTFLSDLSMLEITVFSKDLREASDSGGVGAAKGKYDLWDLVQLDSTTVACITKIDREFLITLDQLGNTRKVLPTQVQAKIPPKRFGAVATDRNGSEIRVEDIVKEVAGGENRQGAILHLHRGFAFLHSKELQGENGGVFVARTTNLATMIAKGGRVASSGPDLAKMNPALMKGKNGQDMPPPVVVPRQGGRDKTIMQTVKVRQGPYKGLMGIIKDATEQTARVELHTKSKTITIEKSKLSYKDQNDRFVSYAEYVTPRKSSGFGQTPSHAAGGITPGWSGGRTPMGAGAGNSWQGSRTPVAAHGGRTPAWNSSSASGDGNRTPAWKSSSWNDGNKTSNPYDGSRTSYGGGGGRTPAWNPGSRTPYTGSDSSSASIWDAGSKTPARGGYGNDGSWNDSYNSSSNTTSRTSSAYNAATPDFSRDFSANTPSLSAPTPGAMSAPTPQPVSAPTPRGWDAPTPGAMGAPTPGASGKGYYDVPTPGGEYSAAKTPGAAWGNGDVDDDDDKNPGYSSPTPSP